MKTVERILKLLSAVAPLTSRRIALALGCDLATVRMLMRELLRTGRVVTVPAPERERHESRGKVRFAYKLPGQPERRHRGVRL